MIATIHTETRARRRHRHTLVIGNARVIRSRSLGRVLATLRPLIRSLGVTEVRRVVR